MLRKETGEVIGMDDKGHEETLDVNVMDVYCGSGFIDAHVC